MQRMILLYSLLVKTNYSHYFIILVVIVVPKTTNIYLKTSDPKLNISKFRENSIH
jgi:hypothetical protein